MIIILVEGFDKKLTLTLIIQQNTLDVNSNALAAATAIGQALKTGQPIPRSNSLQRTASLQRSSLQNGKATMSRTSSLMSIGQRRTSLRTPSTPVAKSNSFSTSNGSTIVLPPRVKPKTQKRHIPGPHGLITIEVPIEEESESATSFTSKTRQPAKRPVKKKTKDNGQAKPRAAHSNSSETNSLRSLNSLNSASRRPILEEPIPEDVPAVFESPTILENETDIDLPNTNEEFEAHLDGVLEDDPTPPIEDSKELEKLTAQKKEQEALVLTELQNEEEQINQDLNNKSVLTDTSDDVPSTAKSQLSSNDVSTLNTELSELQEMKPANSMAQQIRSTIPSLIVSSHGQQTDNSNISSSDQLDVASSLYSSDAEATRMTTQRFAEESDSVIYSTPPQEPELTQAEQELSSINSKTAKRDSLAPKKSALKYKTSSSSINLSDPNNAAADAYISLTTAENTRLNSRPSVSNGNISRSRSNSQTNGLAQTKPKRPQSMVSKPKESPSKAKAARPQSAQVSQPSAYQHAETRTKSASNAAAVNATMKKNEIPKPAERTSSFEKVKTADSNSAFKKKSLRDPSFGTRPATVESNLGFYRNQASSQQRATPTTGTIASQPGYHTEQPTTARSNAMPISSITTTNGSSRFKSRFDDSDSEDELPINTKMLGTQNNQGLRKPKSQYTLRSASNNAVLDQSPAKSMPPADRQRGTRFFSENTQFTTHHHSTPMNNDIEEKKKTSFGGKLKKLFGRNKDKD
ncbi:hypothetical protein WICPIJ_008133 [Wickerhamomyces pijperi]|uniref:Eisosome protein SEG1 n=1 Tax=Wickerhamomyces pijperi TaxID=599730 RepID=A0A9P8TJM3_WICPI|nr:hypothetical protein WICPIJ_008133 [Wickerhamomyces pijperi]